MERMWSHVQTLEEDSFLRVQMRKVITMTALTFMMNPSEEMTKEASMFHFEKQMDQILKLILKL